MAESIVEGLFEVDGDRVTLLGGRSVSSGLVHFPRTDTCPYTGLQDVEPVRLSSEGTVWAVTTVRVAPPGYLGEVPFRMGVVDLPEGVRVIARILGDADVGTPVTCVAEAVVTSDGPRTTWAFVSGERA